jgi:hypothetical protein
MATGCTTTSGLPKVVIATTTYGVGDTAPVSASSGGYHINGTMPDQPTHARVYVWRSNKPSQSDVVKLASVFGLNGTPNRHAHGWDLTSASGELRMRDDQGQLWRYDAATANQSRCHAANFDIDNLPGEGPHYMCASEPAAVTPSGGPAEAATNPAAASLLTTLGFKGDQHAFANQLSS